MYQSLLQQNINSLQSLSSDELRELLGSDAKLEERVDEVIKAFEASKVDIIAENRKIAEANLAYEPQMIERQSRVQELINESMMVGDTVKDKAVELKNKSKTGGTYTLLALLQTAAAESEEESENLVKQFLDSELTTDAYLEQFIGVRKLMHARKLKAEKMVELVQLKDVQNIGYNPPNLFETYVPPRSSGFFSKRLNDDDIIYPTQHETMEEMMERFNVKQ